MEQNHLVSLDKSELVPQTLDLGEIFSGDPCTSKTKLISEGVTRGGIASSLESTLIDDDEELRVWFWRNTDFERWPWSWYSMLCGNQKMKQQAMQVHQVATLHCTLYYDTRDVHSVPYDMGSMNSLSH